jgi:phytoene dehydrogenase-like protein
MFDAIVVGAGHNGLAAAVHLAAKGWKVAVVEQADVPGGAVKTREVTLPGFRHDLFAMNLSLFAGSPFFAAYKDGLIRHGLGIIAASDCFSTAFPDGTWLGVSQDLATTSRRIAALSPKDADSWRAMVSAFESDAPHMFALLASPMPSLAAAKVLWGSYRAKGGAWLGDLGRLMVASPREFLDAHFDSEKLKVMMSAWGMHLDFAPDIAGGALFAYLQSMASQSFGMALGEGGADTIIEALVGYLEALGGEVHLGRAVERIETSGDRASGVRLTGGETLQSRRAVIANVHPKIVFGRLLAQDSRRAAFDARLVRFRAGPATMMIHLALSDLPDWTAGEELRRFAYVHLAPSFDVMAATYAQAMSGLLPDEPVLVVGQPTAIDPSRAPPGRQVFWVQVRVLPGTVRGDAAGAIDGRHWDEVKEPYAERVLALIERYAPGLSGKILGRAVLSPLDLERENPNLIGGDSLSGSHHLDQNFLFRPVFGWSHYKTPVRGLYLVGASTWPGAGVGAGSGFMLAKMLAGESVPIAALAA